MDITALRARMATTVVERVGRAVSMAEYKAERSSFDVDGIAVNDRAERSADESVEFDFA